MFGSAWMRYGLLLAAVGLFAAAATPAAEREARAHGERLVAQYRLPPDSIARYAALAAGQALDTVRNEQSMFADRSPWIGPEQRAGVGHNPYTLVLTVSGVAKAAGDVHAQWQAGWRLRESVTASRELVLALPRIARAGLAAGQPVTLSAISTRVSFRGERNVAPMLGLMQMGNLDLDAVQVQVWSGAAPPAWAEWPRLRKEWLALGLACLLAAWGFKAWTTAPRAAAQPLRSTLPPPEPAWRPWPEAARPVARAARRDAMAPAPMPPPVPRPAAQSHEDRVIAALHQVLTVGLTVHTVLDEARMQRRRRAPQR